MNQKSDTVTEPLAQARLVIGRLRERLRHAVRGRDEVIDLLLVAVLADGHVLLEDYPGSGKTTLAKALGESIFDRLPLEERAEDDVVEAARLAVLYGLEGGPAHLADFRRVQFTPDLLPSDIIGVSIFDTRTSNFDFKPGPVFTYVLLGDEINRTSPKVQSALLEAMAEKQVTIDNHTHRLDEMFFVIATQNPLDLAGTYPLPVAQLDRFLFKIKMEFIDRESEIEVLNSRLERAVPLDEKQFPKVSRTAILEARKTIRTNVRMAPEINECLVDIARCIRSHPQVLQGISTRSLVLMAPALQAAAVLKDRDFVTEDDIRWLAPFVFCHRMALAPGVTDADTIIWECIEDPLEALTRAHKNSKKR